MYTSLHTHTQYSILDGAAPIKKLIARAQELGQTAMAITDHGNMFGVKEFHAAATKAGLKPILGCEVYVATHSRLDKDGKEDRGGDHLILLAKNELGYHNLIKLVSCGWTEGFYYNPRIDKELLEKYHHGIICSSACLGGEIPQLIMSGDLDKASESVAWFKNLFGQDYYLEMQFHHSGNVDLDTRVFQNQVLVNEHLLELSQKYNVKYICTNDVHYVNEEDAPAHDRLICLSTGRDLDDPTRMRYTGQEFLKSEQQMATLFAQYPDAVSTTQEIVDKVEQYSLSHKPFMPNFPLPDDFQVDMEQVRSSMLISLGKSAEENQAKIAFVQRAQTTDELSSIEEYTIASQYTYLAHIATDGTLKRYGSPLTAKVQERLDFELQTIEWMGFPGYFLIVWDFIRAARAMGVSVGPGRGSAAGSVVAYALGITNIDPIKYDLLFERFLNPERISMPDVDIDFDEDGRAKVLRYVVEKYGKKRVAHIITFGTMAARSSIKDVARVHKLPLSESDRLAKLVPDRPGVTLDDAFKEVEELKAEKDSPNELIRDTLRYAEMLEGSVRQTGVHACGVIIAKDDLENYIPVCTAKEAELCVVQYGGGVVEDVGLLKMDFLGLRTLSIIKDAVENVKLSHGIDLDIDNIPLDDKKTFDLYAKGETTGLFQFESPGMKKHLKNLQPNRFEDLIAMNALYRPGPMEYIDSFINRKHGREKIEYDLPQMEEYLADTYGITVYQEQVMLLSQSLAGFTKGQADTLRKAMGKKQIAVLDKMKPKFLEGAANNGHDKAICDKIWKDWEEFAKYAFNKSHSTCYAYVSYQTAYLKAHYPAEFMAALLSRNLADITKISFFMDECKRMGAAVLGPDVNLSRGRFAVDKQGHIRFGMNGIKGVGANAVQAIIDEREASGPFKDIYDFVERVPLTTVNKKCIECLALSGALDSLTTNHRSLYFSADNKGVNFIELLIRYGQLVQSERNSSQHSLFGDMLSEAMIQKPQPPSREEWSKLEMLDKEREMVGIYLSDHPLEDFRIVIDNYCNHKVADLQDLKPLLGQDVVIGGMITDAKHLTTKTGKPYGRFTIEDFSGSHEFTLFSRDWEGLRIYCMPQNTMLIRARVQEHPFREGELELKITSMKSLSEVMEKDINQLYLSIAACELSDVLLEDLTGLIDSNAGRVAVAINVVDVASGINVVMRSRGGKVEINSAVIDFLRENNLNYRINS